MTRAEGKNCVMRAAQVVHIENPHVTSPAALVLLAKKYVALDKTIYTDTRMSRIRRRWMRDQIKQSGGKLTCAICGRTGLNPALRHGHRNLATLDHIIEISNNGLWNDPSNFQVACYRCNCRKEKNGKTHLTSLM